MIRAIPWILFSVAILALVIELLVSHNTDAKAQAGIAELLRQQRTDQDDVYEARSAYHRVVHERDEARRSLREALNIQRDAYVRLRPGAPIRSGPAIVGDAPTQDFTQIVERNNWPIWPGQ